MTAPGLVQPPSGAGPPSSRTCSGTLPITPTRCLFHHRTPVWRWGGPDPRCGQATRLGPVPVRGHGGRPRPGWTGLACRHVGVRAGERRGVPAWPSVAIRLASIVISVAGVRTRRPTGTAEAARSAGMVCMVIPLVQVVLPASASRHPMPAPSVPTFKCRMSGSLTEARHTRRTRVRLAPLRTREGAYSLPCTNDHWRINANHSGPLQRQPSPAPGSQQPPRGLPRSKCAHWWGW